MTEKSKFTKREWIHLIITLSIVQAFIWWVSFQFAGNSSALGYVSFAGTLISIILAVLAIGYTYGESHQQKNTSETLSTQIDSLIKIKDKLEIQADALNGIDKLHIFLNNLSQKVDGHFEETKTKIDGFKYNFQSFDSKDSGNSPNKKIEHNLVIDGLFSSKSSYFIKLCLILSLLYWEQRDQSDTLSKLMEYIEALEIEELDEDNRLIFFGGGVNLLHIFNNLGCISKERNYIEPYLLTFFNAFIKDESPSFNDTFNGAAKEIKLS